MQPEAFLRDCVFVESLSHSQWHINWDGWGVGGGVWGEAGFVRGQSGATGQWGGSWGIEAEGANGMQEGKIRAEKAGITSHCVCKTA